MKKIFISFALLCVASYGGYKMYNSYESVGEEDFLLQNVEALSLESEAAISSECQGPPLYAEVGVYSSLKNVHTHLNDSMDIISVYSIKSCVAKGIGKKNGIDAIIDTQLESSKEGKCTGYQNHNSLY